MMAEPVAKQLQTPGTFRLVQTEAGVCLHLSGDWTLPHYRRLRQAIDKLGQQAEASIDCAQLQALDTAGAALLGRFLGAERLQALAKSTSGLAPERRALLQAVGKALDQPEEPVPSPCWRGSPGWARCWRPAGAISCCCSASRA